MFKLLSFRSDGAFWPLAERPDAEPASAVYSILALPLRLAAAIRREWAARRAMDALAELDDRLLQDIGISRDSIASAVRHGRAKQSARDASWPTI